MARNRFAIRGFVVLLVTLLSPGLITLMVVGLVSAQNGWAWPTPALTAPTATPATVAEPSSFEDFMHTAAAPAAAPGGACTTDADCTPMGNPAYVLGRAVFCNAALRCNFCSNIRCGKTGNTDNDCQNGVGGTTPCVVSDPQVGKGCACTPDP